MLSAQSMTLSLSTEGIFVFDQQQRILTVNAAALAMFGYSAEELLGQPLETLLPERYRRVHQEHFEQFSLTDRSESEMGAFREIYARHKNGSEFPVRAAIGKELVDGQLQMIAVMRDIGEQRLVQNELELAQAMLQSASNLILVSNSRMKIIYVSRSIRQILGYEPEEVLGDGWWQIIGQSKGSVAVDREYVRRAAAGEIPVDPTAYEHELRHRDGSRRWLQISDSKGPADLLIGIGTDITNLKLAQEATRQRNNFLNKVMEDVGQGMTVTDKNGRFEYVNPAYARMLGYQPADLIGKTPYDVNFPDDQAVLAEAQAQRQAGLTTTYETRLRAVDGRELFVTITGVPRNHNGEYGGAVSVITDLSERRRLESELRDSEAGLRALYEVAAREAPFEEKMHSLLRMGIQHFGLEMGVLARLEGESYRPLVSEPPDAALQWGEDFNPCAACIDEPLQNAEPWAFENVGISPASEGRALRPEDHPVDPSQESVQSAPKIHDPHPFQESVGVQSYLGSQVVCENRLVGSLCFLSRKSHPHPFRAVEKELVRLMAQWIGVEMERENTTRRLKEYADQIEQSNRDLAVARDQAMEGSRLKSSFLAMMSHEIRTPMNAILGMNELLLDTDLDEQQREFATIVGRSADALLALINDILDLSKIEAGKMVLHPQPFRPAGVITETLELFRLKAAEKQIQLISRIDGDVPAQVVGDPDRIRQILVNLVGNAVKFTNYGAVFLNMAIAKEDHPPLLRHHPPRAPAAGGQGPALRPALRRPDEGPDEGPDERWYQFVRFDVRDTGMGISEASKHALFEPFTQADDSATRKFGGTGLGLAISRRLVELMGGKIGFDSKEGLGSHFWFTIPLVLEIEKALPPADSSERAPDRLGNRLRFADRKPVLVVEDSPTNRVVILHQLKELGIRAEALESGQAAVDHIRQYPEDFSLVLMDMLMPEVSGVMATRMIRQEESQTGLHIPIVAITASAMPEDRAVCLEAGMDDYLNKPVSLNRLEEILQKWVS